MIDIDVNNILNGRDEELIAMAKFSSLPFRDLGV
jgi:hypothetical protein